MKCFLRALALTLLCSIGVTAKSHFVFSMDDASWLANNVVVATQGSEIDGQVTVLESWQGDQKPGDSLHFAGLTRFKSEQSRHIECVNRFGDVTECTDGSPKVVSGSRIILFLAKNSHQSGSGKWSLIGDLWLEQGRAYGLYDLSVFTDYGTEQSVKDAVTRVSHEKATLKAALEIEDSDKRIEDLQPLAKSSVQYTSMVASVEIEALKKIPGSSGKTQESSGQTILMSNCKDDCVGDFLALVLTRELDFWKETAPTIKVGWWNDSNMSDSEMTLCRRHHSDTERTLNGLLMINDGDSEAMVRQLRDCFLSISEQRDRSLIIDSCNSYLNSLQSNGSTRKVSSKSK